MAFNDGATNNNNNKQNYQQESYSIYGVSNLEGVEPSKLSYSYWAGNLVIAISPKKNSGRDEVAFDYENNAKIFLTHHNARIFKTLLEDWMNNPSKYNNVGVATRSGSCVAICDGKEFGCDSPCLYIRKINESTGIPDSTFVYTFRENFYYGIVDYNSKNGDFKKSMFDNLEIKELYDVLNMYILSMTGAIGYAVREELKYDLSRLNTKADAICEKLGIEYGKKGNYSNNNNYFNNNKSNTSSFDGMNQPTGGRPTRNTSVDELDDGLE